MAVIDAIIMLHVSAVEWDALISHRKEDSQQKQQSMLLSQQPALGVLVDRFVSFFEIRSSVQLHTICR